MSRKIDLTQPLSPEDREYLVMYARQADIERCDALVAEQEKEARAEVAARTAAGAPVAPADKPVVPATTVTPAAAAKSPATGAVASAPGSAPVAPAAPKV